MNGLSANGVSVFLGKIPGRKQECLYFETDGIIWPVGYIPPRYLKDAKRLWARFIGDSELRGRDGFDIVELGPMKEV